jgi:hypothetical protein
VRTRCASLLSFGLLFGGGFSLDPCVRTRISGPTLLMSGSMGWETGDGSTSINGKQEKREITPSNERLPGIFSALVRADAWIGLGI